MDFFKNIVKFILKSLFSACIVNLLIIFAIIYLLGSSANKVIRESQESLKKGTVLFVDTSMQLSDIALSDRTDIVVSDYAKMSLLELYERIVSAGKDPLVDAIFLYNTKSAYNFNLSQSLAIKKALGDFKKSGKKVYCYLASSDIKQSEYFLATIADEIWINPQSILDFSGISFQGVFFANAFEKYGIKANIVKCGDNKSFGDMFTRSDFAPKNKEELEAIAKSLTAFMHSRSAELRGVNKEDCISIKTTTPLVDANTALQYKLVDKVFYRDQADGLLSRTYPKYNKLDVKSYTPNYRLNKAKAKSNIAIVYMTGSIAEFGSQSNVISSARYCRILNDIRLDDSIKAVVLDINSGGGSAYASEQIRREVELLAKTKPTITYITSMCASGAYWIATATDKIFAQETSLIGSIGVFSALFDVQGLGNNFGVTFDVAKSSPYADIFSSLRSPSPEELAIMQGQVNVIYNNFVSLVASSRKLSEETVRKDIATGSVWTSAKAKELGLIDCANNNLPATLREIAKGLNLEGTDYGILTYPTPKTYKELLREIFTGETSISAKFFMPKAISEQAEVEEFISTFSDKKGLYLRSPLLLKEF